VAFTRDLGNPFVYVAAAVADPLVRDPARRIELEPLAETLHETHGVWPAEVVIEHAGRRHTLSTRPYKGSAPNPFTWDEMVEKFRRYTAPVIDAPRATAIIDAVGGLEGVTDVAEVARLVALA
jgi:2-methylcitrate dehydratase PrpD